MVDTSEVSKLVTEVSDLFVDASVFADPARDSWLFQFTSGLDVIATLEEDRHALAISAELGILPEENRVDLLGYFLKVNQSWAGTGSLRFAMLADTDKTITLLWDIPMNGLARHDLFAALSEFAERAQGWRELLKAGVLLTQELATEIPQNSLKI
ncbi:type III secretion system chaperone [Pseudovibrio sp. WM33]|uniref:type III secretion system chaperone n=1 Tax=Pseudovibrio sp. WM33 TaxID=1735585 RepID=UPI0007AED1B9|nr:type III secretion system chaperone [Pseudovibrio sp. WM33]KZL27655.1 Tir chaperone protein (CesT) [Pseudovibrio sp. WM33]